MKSLHLVFLGTFIFNCVHAQYFVPMQDAMGLIRSQSELNLLNEVSEELINSLPDSFQANFKVYDFGVYNHQSSYTESTYNLVSSIEDEVLAITDFYFIIIRMTDALGDQNVIVKLKMPETDNFECMTPWRWDAFAQILVNNLLEQIVDNHSSVVNAQVDAIEHLKEKIVDVVLCCDPGRGSCDVCMSNIEMTSMFEGYGFWSYDCTVNGSEIVGSNNSDIYDYAGLNISSGLISGDIDVFFAGILESANETGSRVFITKSETFCGTMDLDTIFNMFEINGPSDGDIWVSVIDNPGDEDQLFMLSYDLSTLISDDVYDSYELMFGVDQVQNCKSTNRFGATSLWSAKEYANDGLVSLAQGIFAHIAISGLFKTVLTTCEFEYSVPFSGKKGNRPGYVDIRDEDNFFEVKGINHKEDAIYEISRYIELANIYCPNVNYQPWTRGGWPPPLVNPIEVPVLNKMATFRQNGIDELGLVLYSIDNSKNVPPAVPVVIPEDIRIRILDFLNSISSTPYAIQLILVNDYLITNPDALYYVQQNIPLLSTLLVSSSLIAVFAFEIVPFSAPAISIVGGVALLIMVAKELPSASPPKS